MNQKVLFKRLLIISFVFNLLSTIYLFFFTPDEINKINDSLLPNISEELSYILLVILILAVLISFCSYFFLYNFKKIGKLLFIVPIFIISSVQLFIPNASDGLQLLLDTVICLADGGIITLMYFTNISKEFANWDLNSTKWLSLEEKYTSRSVIEYWIGNIIRNF